MRAWFLVLLVGLAGCVKSSGAPPEAEVPAASPLPATDPRIGPAAQPPNQTIAPEEGLAGRAHSHDLWGAATRRTLFDDVLVMGARTHNRATARAIPWDGEIVIEGTAQLEATISGAERGACSRFVIGGFPSCTPSTADPLPPDDLALRFRHASAEEWSTAGTLVWDAPLAIPVEDPTWIDLPHSDLSLWAFEIVSPDPADETLRFRLRIDIVRSEGEIPLWPGHPRFYDNETRVREVFAGPRSTTVGPADIFSSVEEENAFLATKLISLGTRTVVVDVNITRLDTPPGVGAAYWYLAYTNATGRWRVTDWGDPLHPGHQTDHRYVLEVEEAGIDSPYAESSRWRFALLGSFRVGHPTDEDFSIAMSRGATYAVEYNARVLASDLHADEFGGASALDRTEDTQDARAPVVSRNS